MDIDSEHREALAAAGHTGMMGTVLFCAVLAVVGGLVGSVVLAILWNVLVPGTPESVSTMVGAFAGVALGIAIGLTKIVRGNREAAELVEDREWRRELLRQHGTTRAP